MGTVSRTWSKGCWQELNEIIYIYIDDISTFQAKIHEAYNDLEQSHGALSGKGSNTKCALDARSALQPRDPLSKCVIRYPRVRFTLQMRCPRSNDRPGTWSVLPEFPGGIDQLQQACTMPEWRIHYRRKGEDDNRTVLLCPNKWHLIESFIWHLRDT